MFNLSRLPGHRRSGGSPPHKGNEPGIRLLVITADFDFYSRLSEAASGCGWSVRAAFTLGEAVPHVQDGSFPLVVYDCNAADDWRVAFDSLRSVNSSVCLVLASRATDPYLWQEVIQAGGFDLISRSAPPDEVTHKLRFAWFWNETSQPASNRQTGLVSEKSQYSNDDAPK